LGSKVTHEPTGIPRSLWTGWNSLGATVNLYKMIGVTTWGETVLETIEENLIVVVEAKNRMVH